MAFNPQPKQGIKKKTPKGLKKTFKPTGEGSVFEDVLDALGDTVATCFVCGDRITLVTHHNFAHILPKKKYSDFRLNPENIKLMCFKFIADEKGQGCHYDWDFKPRSTLTEEKWEKVFSLEEQLKKEYAKRNDVNGS